MDKRNRPALGFLLVGIGAAGRALMAVPETVSIAELTLSALMVVGYIVLLGQTKLPVVLGAAALLAELVLCSAGLEQYAVPAAILRMADLWMLYSAATITLRAAARLSPALYGKGAKLLPVITAAALGIQNALQAAALALPAAARLSSAASAMFVVFSVLLLGYTLLLLRAYNALRIKKERKRTL